MIFCDTWYAVVARLTHWSFSPDSQVDKSPQSSEVNVPQLFSVIEQKSLEREISRVRHELELAEKKLRELEQRVNHPLASPTLSLVIARCSSTAPMKR